MAKKIAQKYKVIREPVDEYRKGHIDMFLEYLRKEKPKPGTKNLVQSLVYLMLNDKFHSEIIKIRKKFGIPFLGFDSQNQFDDWSTKDKISKLYEDIGIFLKKHELTYEKFIPLVSKIFVQYVCLIKLDYADKKIKSAHVAKLKAYFANISNDYGKVVGGFDVPDPKFGKNNTNDFDKVWWEFYLYPSDNMVKFRQNLKKYFVWMMGFHYKDHVNEITEEFFKFSNRQVIENYSPRIKKQIIIEVVQEDGRISLKFQTYLNTTTKELMRAFERKQKELQELKKKSLHSNSQACLFTTKINQHFCYLEGGSPSDMYVMLYGKSPRDLYIKEMEAIRSSSKDTIKKIHTAFKRKLCI